MNKNEQTMEGGEKRRTFQIKQVLNCGRMYIIENGNVSYMARRTRCVQKMAQKRLLELESEGPR